MEKPEAEDVKTSQRATRFIIIGIILTLFNFLIYTILANLVFKNDNLLWLASLIGTLASTFLAYYLHSRITWKERNITKTAILKFFIWSLALSFIFYPALTQLFSLMMPIYEFAYSIIQNLHLPISYELTLSTGSFIFATIITMILNYLFYDTFVFGKNEPKKEKK